MRSWPSLYLAHSTSAQHWAYDPALSLPAGQHCNPHSSGIANVTWESYEDLQSQESVQQNTDCKIKTHLTDCQADVATECSVSGRHQHRQGLVMQELPNTLEVHIEPEVVSKHLMCMRMLNALLQAQDLPHPSASS